MTTISYTMNGTKQKVKISEATPAELELAATEGSYRAKKELEKRRRKY